jgi:hypothetical protein
MDVLMWARNQWDRVLAWVVVGIGTLVLILGWVGVTSTPYTFEQIPYVVSGGLGGIFLLGIAAMLWISADLRDEWRLLQEMLERDAEAQTPPAAETVVLVEPEKTTPTATPKAKSTKPATRRSPRSRASAQS